MIIYLQGTAGLSLRLLPSDGAGNTVLKFTCNVETLIIVCILGGGGNTTPERQIFNFEITDIYFDEHVCM